MARQATTSIISENQGKNFKTIAEQTVNGVDLNYEGNVVTPLAGEQPLRFVLSGTDAVKNKVMFYLTSIPGDYVRNPAKGGILHPALGKALTKENTDNLTQYIKTAFETMFSADLKLVHTEVSPNIENKRWDITIVVEDLIRREFFDLQLAVTND